LNLAAVPIAVAPMQQGREWGRAIRSILPVVSLLAIVSLLFLSQQEAWGSLVEESGDDNSNAKDSSVQIPGACMCVVFRLDDIQDNFVSSAQVKAMNLFISRDQPLSLGLVMNNTGDDVRIMGKIGEGIHRGIFELGLHGWDHVDYTKMSLEEQESTLIMANEKLSSIFGNVSDIFVPPYAYFDEATLEASANAGIKVLSAALFSEESYDNGNSIFNATERGDVLDRGLRTGKNAIASSSNITTTLDHIPGTTQFKEYENGKSVKVPVEDILKDIQNNLLEYGYSIIVFHPQDLVQMSENGTLSDSTASLALDTAEIDDLSELIDTIISKDIRIATLSDIAGIEKRSYSYFR
jgi:peptidoglycan/xylan/chitin deacetylase (PgdA/CDA1 family)